MSRDPMDAKTRVGAWWLARRWAKRAVVERIEITDDELRDHCFEVLTDPSDSPATGCILCLVAKRRGIWSELGFDDVLEGDDDVQH